MAEGHGKPGREFQELENDLLTRAGRGDRAAFKALYERFQRPLFGFLLRMVKDQAMANELLNDVMLDVWRSASSFEGRSSAGSWIFGIAHNKAISLLRRRREDQMPEDAAESLVDDAATPAETAEQADLGRVMRRLLDKLSPEHRAVLQLTYYQDMSVQEIAVSLDCPVNTVKTRMFYGRQRMRELLSAAGIQGVSA
ncbi:MAG: sigma-70 family RNA polymerase sigma factor [Alphaproteobacteria bacterium]|nr:sigma-70 family RNA polymerase sigma factor [Alphaproteobacteria bacterium]